MIAETGSTVECVVIQAVPQMKLCRETVRASVLESKPRRNPRHLECGNSLPLCGAGLLAKSGSLLPRNRQGSAIAQAKMRIPAFPGGKPPCPTAGRHLKAAMNRRTPDPVPHDRSDCRKGYQPQSQLWATVRAKPGGVTPKAIMVSYQSADPDIYALDWK
jgi:hypothetical protein